jgi:ubiquinone/menaquinone biosynthesis C-methylase UbiE
MPAAAAPPGPLRESLRYLNWVFNPLQSLDVTQVYDLLSTRAPTERGLWLNLGYWREARTLDDACVAMAELLAERSDMQSGDRVLDVGFGFADQDIHWARHQAPQAIVGLNITASQVAVARARVADLGLSDRIDLREGSATAMPLPDGTFDVVTALECAFHFRTRADFFVEAHRVLRPGGRLVVADILPMPPVTGRTARLKQRASWAMVSSKFRIPEENRYTSDEYAARLADAGFTGVQVESIRHEVYAPLHHYLARNQAPVARLHPLARVPAQLALSLNAETVYGGLDYVLAVARKPG